MLLAIQAGTRATSDDIVILTRATANMGYGKGFCEPPATGTILNAADLESLLMQLAM